MLGPFLRLTDRFPVYGFTRKLTVDNEGRMREGVWVLEVGQYPTRRMVLGSYDSIRQEREYPNEYEFPSLGNQFSGVYV